MYNVIVSLADVNIAVNCLFSETVNFLKDYTVDAEPDFSVSVSEEDIEYEREKSASEDRFEGKAVRSFSDKYLETLSVYRKISELMPAYGVFLFHGSVISVDNEAYLFTAKSGTGKSTHTRLWREHFGDRAFMVNDDKPLIKVTDDGAFVYGTPWNGKHRLSKNVCVRLKALAVLHRGTENTIEQTSAVKVKPMLIQQAYRSKNPAVLIRILSLLDEFSKKIELYDLYCNMEPEACEVAYKGMNDGKGDF